VVSDLSDDMIPANFSAGRGTPPVAEILRRTGAMNYEAQQIGNRPNGDSRIRIVVAAQRPTAHTRKCRPDGRFVSPARRFGRAPAMARWRNWFAGFARLEL
jgi:hypothetical protein